MGHSMMHFRSRSEPHPRLLWGWTVPIYTLFTLLHPLTLSLSDASFDRRQLSELLSSPILLSQPPSGLHHRRYSAYRPSIKTFPKLFQRIAILDIEIISLHYSDLWVLRAFCASLFLSIQNKHFTLPSVFFS